MAIFNNELTEIFTNMFPNLNLRFLHKLKVYIDDYNVSQHSKNIVIFSVQYINLYFSFVDVDINLQEPQHVSQHIFLFYLSIFLFV